MSTITAEPQLTVEPAAVRAWAQGRTIYVELHDGRTIGFPAEPVPYPGVGNRRTVGSGSGRSEWVCFALGGIGRRHHRSRDRGRPFPIATEISHQVLTLALFGFAIILQSASFFDNDSE